MDYISSIFLIQKTAYGELKAI